MKQKVISYKKDGNSLKQSYMELEQMSSHVYVANRETTHYEVDLSLVFEINGIYFVNCRCRESILQKEGNLEKAEWLALNYMQDVMTDERVYPTLLILELFRQAGTEEQVNKLITRRENILKAREDRKRKEMEKRKQEKEQQALAHEKEYQDAVSQFLHGEFIDTGFVTEMLRRNTIKIHPRTLCNLQNYCSKISTGSIRIRDKKRSYDGVFSAIKELHQKLTTLTE